MRESNRMEDGSPDFSLLGQLMGRVLTQQPGLPVQKVGVDCFLKQKTLMRPRRGPPSCPLPACTQCQVPGSQTLWEGLKHLIGLLPR